MQIANGTLILCPENHQAVYNVTPAEALIMHRMHFQNANGSPLGEFFIQDGEAVTVDAPAKPAQEQETNLVTGKVTPAREAIPAVTHKRTNAEEITRLKKKYTGQINVGDRSLPAFEAVFGNASAVKLPETFAELEIGHHFREQNLSEVESADRSRHVELSKKIRAELCNIAAALDIKVHSQDTKDQIIFAIIEAEKTPQPA